MLFANISKSVARDEWVKRIKPELVGPGVRKHVTAGAWFTLAAVPCDPSLWSGPQTVPYPRNVARFRDL